MYNGNERPSCMARLLDVRGYVLAVRRSLLHAEPGGQVFMVALFGLISLVLLPFWISFDLLSTWEFTTAVRHASADAVYDAAAYTEGLLNMSVGALIVGIVFTSFTLLPSLFELALPTVNHPLVNLVLWVSIIFDYVTDWPKAASVAGQWAEQPVVAFLYTMIFCAFVSVGLQALLAISLTVVVFGIYALVSGGARHAEAVIIRQ